MWINWWKNQFPWSDKKGFWSGANRPWLALFTELFSKLGVKSWETGESLGSCWCWRCGSTLGCRDDASIGYGENDHASNADTWLQWCASELRLPWYRSRFWPQFSMGKSTGCHPNGQLWDLQRSVVGQMLCQVIWHRRLCGLSWFCEQCDQSTQRTHHPTLANRAITCPAGQLFKASWDRMGLEVSSVDICLLLPEIHPSWCSCFFRMNSLKLGRYVSLLQIVTQVYY